MQGGGRMHASSLWVWLEVALLGRFPVSRLDGSFSGCLTGLYVVCSAVMFTSGSSIILEVRSRCFGRGMSSGNVSFRLFCCGGLGAVCSGGMGVGAVSMSSGWGVSIGGALCRCSCGGWVDAIGGVGACGGGGVGAVSIIMKS